MKHTQIFNDFLKNDVNLNQSRLEVLEQRLETITNFIKSSDLLKNNYIEAKPQGSYAHKTIIKPQKNKEFDVDILLYLDKLSEWQPADYINKIYDLFKDNGTYKKIVHRRTRCICLDYSGDFHIDVVPCIKEKEETYSICNRKDNVTEPTDGDGYNNWWQEKNKLVGNNQLVKATRLTKYIRDTKVTFSAKSILLTTLLGNQIRSNELNSEFVDLPTSLITVFNRLNTYLQDNEEMPRVENPVLDTEDFNRHWDQDKYSNFRNQIETYTTKINDAFDEKGRDESIKKWRKVFGDNFGDVENSNAKNSNIVKKSTPAAPWSKNVIRKR